LSKARSRWRAPLALLLFLPLTLPGLFIGLALLVLFGRVDVSLSLTTVTIAHLVYVMPYFLLIALAALQRLDPALEEAGADLGANGWLVFRRVTLPLALPGVFAGSLLTFIPAVGDFINAELLGDPRSQMIGNVIQARFLRVSDYPTGAALSFILMAAIIIGVLLYARLVGTEELTGGTT